MLCFLKANRVIAHAMEEQGSPRALCSSRSRRSIFFSEAPKLVLGLKNFALFMNPLVLPVTLEYNLPSYKQEQMAVGQVRTYEL